MDSTLRSLSRLITGIAITGLIAMLALPAFAQQSITVERLPALESPTSLVQAAPAASQKPAQAVQKKKVTKAAAKKPAKKVQPAKTASAKKKPVKKTPVKAGAKKSTSSAGTDRA